jgi:alpha-beta hydrolase superfamily lysophospholipase
VWNLPIEGDTTRSLVDVVLNVLPKLIVNANGNSETVVKTIGEMIYLFEKLEMNDDGSSKYNISPVPQNARDARWDVMLEREQERWNNQRPATKTLLEYLPADHIYLFAADWRKGQLDGAERLHQFIQEVKEDAGHDKVSLFGVSYGGQLATAYFTFYGGEDIDRAVLQAPAIRGSALTADLLEDPNFAFDPETFFDLAAVFIDRELSLDQRLKGLDLPLINSIVMQVIRTYLQPIFLKFGSFWDIVPPEDYARLKAKYLDPEKNAEIIRKSDIVHNEMMANAGKTLRAMQKQGVKIAIICGVGLPMASGNPSSSDYIIEVASTAGARALPLGSKGVAVAPADSLVCADPAHRHRSPDGSIDAACAYLPENTWFFQRQYHGQAHWDIYARALYQKWLCTDELRDVHSDPNFPQFRNSSNHSDGLELRFSGSVSGYLTEGDETLLVTNLSAYDISLVDLLAEGLRLEVPVQSRLALSPGETLRLRYEAILPAKETIFQLTVKFVREAPVPAKETRTYTFTALPAHTKVPVALRFPAPAPTAAPLHLRPVRTLLIFLALSVSLALASVAVGVMYRGKLRKEKARS